MILAPPPPSDNPLQDRWLHLLYRRVTDIVPVLATAASYGETLAAGATTEILVGGGASALPVWTTATGTGAPVRADSPTLITPALGTPSALVGTNITGTAASLTAGNVTTNANLTGHITSVGNAAVLGSFTMAQLDAAVSDGNVIYSGQALGTPSSGTLTNCSGTAASLTAGNVTTNANLTGHVTSSGNAAVLGSFTFAQLNTAVSDAEVARTDAANTFTGTQTFSNLIAAAAGSVGAPSIYMTGYATTGWYNIGANNWGFAVSGAKVLDIASTGLAIAGTLSASGTTTLARVNQSNGSIDFSSLGNGSTSWQIGTVTAGKPLDIFTGGVVRAQFSDTGLAVTGALSATGNISATAGDVLIRGATGGLITQNTVAGGLYFANTGISTDMRFYTTDGAGASVLALTLNNTTGLGEFANGLAVTGAISATGTSSLARIDQSNGSIDFASLGNGSTSWQIGTVTAGKPLDLFIGGSVIATVSTTGLAVTGDISVSTKTPASAAAAGVAGTITWDADYLYVCTATNTWKRVAIATW